VFATQFGAALDAANVRKMFKRVCRLAGVGDGWTSREIRTSLVSLMSHHGASIEEIARLVGHSSTSDNRGRVPPRAVASDHDRRRDHG
jgi:site-specific recombinase XerD